MTYSAWLVSAGLVKARYGRRGTSGCVMARIRMARQAGRGSSWLGVAGLGMAGTAWIGRSCLGPAWRGKAGVAGRGSARQGPACSGLAGEARHGTALKQFMFFQGEPGVDGQKLVRIEGEPELREDVVKVGRNGTDLRYRPEFAEWSTTLEVIYVTSALTRGSVLSLIDAGGMGVGVGEWRPEKDGDFGTFRVDPTREVQVINEPAGV